MSSLRSPFGLTRSLDLIKYCGDSGHHTSCQWPSWDSLSPPVRCQGQAAPVTSAPPHPSWQHWAWLIMLTASLSEPTTLKSYARFCCDGELRWGGGGGWKEEESTCGLLQLSLHGLHHGTGNWGRRGKSRRPTAVATERLTVLRLSASRAQTHSLLCKKHKTMFNPLEKGSCRDRGITGIDVSTLFSIDLPPCYSLVGNIFECSTLSWCFDHLIYSRVWSYSSQWMPWV